MSISEPLRHTYTYNELTQNFPVDERYELCEGVPYQQAWPSIRHQSIMMEISSQIHNFLRDKPCRVFTEASVWLDSPSNIAVSHNYVIPDIVVVCHPDKILPMGINGAPDLVIEIVSASTALLDRHRKLVMYQTAGVREYWVVETELKFISVYILQDGKFWIKTIDGEKAPVGIIPGLEIDLKPVFPEEPKSEISEAT